MARQQKRRKRKASADEPKAYDDYVRHPRYGRGPRLTDETLTDDRLHWRYGGERIIPGTGIPALTSRQSRSMFPLPVYFDVDSKCRDCGRRFLFFAAEQKHWYETLEIPLEASCVRCPECRRWRHHLRARHRRYEELLGLSGRSLEQSLELVDCALTLVEAGIFQNKVFQRMRAVLNSLPAAERDDHRVQQRRSQLQALETKLSRSRTRR